jgi:hypothetical protein
MSILEESTIAVLGSMMGCRPIIFYSRGGNLLEPYVKGADPDGQ